MFLWNSLLQHLVGNNVKWESFIEHKPRLELLGLDTLHVLWLHMYVCTYITYTSHPSLSLSFPIDIKKQHYPTTYEIYLTQTIHTYIYIQPTQPTSSLQPFIFPLPFFPLIKFGVFLWWSASPFHLCICSFLIFIVSWSSCFLKISPFLLSLEGFKASIFSWIHVESLWI